MVKSLAAYQRHCARGRRNIQRESMEFKVDLDHWVEKNKLPELLSDMQHDKIYAVQMPAEQQPDRPAVALIGRTQVGWLQQLVAHHGEWALHVDGKHKLCQGDDMMLITYGTHTVELCTPEDGRSTKRGIVHVFRPLLYLIAQGHEDTDTVVFGLKAAEVVVRK